MVSLVVSIDFNDSLLSFVHSALLSVSPVEMNQTIENVQFVWHQIR